MTRRASGRCTFIPTGTIHALSYAVIPTLGCTFFICDARADPCFPNAQGSAWRMRSYASGGALSLDADTIGFGPSRCTPHLWYTSSMRFWLMSHSASNFFGVLSCFCCL